MKCKNLILNSEKSGEGMILSLTDKRTIECRKITEKQVSNKKITLCECDSDSFDGLIKEETVYLLTKDTDGKIVCFKIQGDALSEKTVLTDTSGNDALFENYAIFSNGNIFLFMYTVSVDKRCVLCWQMFDKTVTPPQVVCEINPEKNQVFYGCDNSGKVSVFYCEKSGKTIEKRAFSFGDAEWGAFEVVLPNAEEISHMFFAETEDKVDMCYKRGGTLMFGCFDKTKKTTSEKLLSRRHTSTSSAPILVNEENTVALLWHNRNVVYSCCENKETGIWNRITEERITSDTDVEICKMRHHLYKKPVYDLFYIKGGEVTLLRSKEFFVSVNEEERVENMNNIKSREEIEREKEEIMKRLGIEKSNDSFDFETENALSEKKMQRFSSDENRSLNNADSGDAILKELKKINRALVLLNQNIERKYENRENKKRTGNDTKRISAKMHKK